MIATGRVWSRRVSRIGATTHTRTMSWIADIRFRSVRSSIRRTFEAAANTIAAAAMRMIDASKPSPVMRQKNDQRSRWRWAPKWAAMAARIQANREGGAGGGGFGSGGGEAAAGALGADMVASPGEGSRRRSRVVRDVESPGRNVGDGSYSSAEAVAGGLFFGRRRRLSERSISSSSSSGSGMRVQAMRIRA